MGKNNKGAKTPKVEKVASASPEVKQPEAKVEATKVEATKVDPTPAPKKERIPIVKPQVVQSSDNQDLTAKDAIKLAKLS